MKSDYFKFFLTSCAAVLVFAAGYVCREYLGGWLLRVHSGPLSEQVSLLVEGITRVTLTAVTVAFVVLLLSGISFLLVAVVQELYYQLLYRKIISRSVKYVEEEREGRHETDSKKPVSARRYDRRPKADPLLEKLNAIRKSEIESLQNDAELGDEESLGDDSPPETGSSSSVFQRPLSGDVVAEKVPADTGGESKSGNGDGQQT